MTLRAFVSFWTGVGLSVTSCQDPSQTQFLPEPVTNQAVALATVDGHPMIYSFYGLDSTLKWDGVHKKVFQLDIQKGISTQLADVPEPYGRLAASAVTIKNKIYVAGGYSVFSNGKEKSSPYLFEFDPRERRFQRKKDPLLPVDDHVQAVWRDSLMYVISGWCDSTTVSTVQLYNPASNEWLLATPVPEEADAKVFGGCGTIAGDVIYYLGGAVFGKFYPPARVLYKGEIDVQNPTSIRWTRVGTYPGESRYRSAALYENGRIYFFGGSNETYNYSGISYAQKKPVEPNRTILVFDVKQETFSISPVPSPLWRMDLRNIVPDGNGFFYVVGGMKNNQSATRDVVRFSVSGF